MKVIETRQFKSISQKKIELSDMEFIIKKTLGEKAKIKLAYTAAQGNVNSSYVIEAGNPKEKFFLKVEDSDNIPRLYSGQIEKEVEGIRLCRKEKIPCANIASWDITMRDIGKKYILTEYIEGDMLSDRWKNLNYEQKLDIKREILDIIYKMQNIKAPCFGDIYENGSIGRYSYWREAVTALMDIATRDCLKLGTLKQEEAELIKEASNKSLKKLSKEYVPCFSHMDIHYHNVLVNHHGGIFKISGIVDFGSSLYSPGFTDEYRLQPNFLYGIEDFYDEKIRKPFKLTEDEIFSAKLLNMIDYYVFLSTINETECARKNISTACKEYLDRC